MPQKYPTTRTPYLEDREPLPSCCARLLGASRKRYRDESTARMARDSIRSHGRFSAQMEACKRGDGTFHVFKQRK